MTAEPAVLVLVLLAALLHAGWNAIMKTSLAPRPEEGIAAADLRLLTPALVVVMSSLAALALALFAEPPAAASWPALAASVLIHTGYFTLLALAYRVGDLSQVYPIARGLGPLLVALVSGAIFGEVLVASEMAGIVLVSLGIAALAAGRQLLAAAERKPVALALLTGATIAAYTVVDAIGVRRSESPAGYAAWLMMLTGLPFAAYALRRGGRRALPFLARHWRAGAAAGLMNFAAYALVLWALSLGAVAHVAALRETSVIFATLLGTLFLGERFGGRRVLAAAVVAAGILLLHL